MHDIVRVDRTPKTANFGWFCALLPKYPPPGVKNAPPKKGLRAMYTTFWNPPFYIVLKGAPKSGFSTQGSKMHIFDPPDAPGGPRAFSQLQTRLFSRFVYLANNFFVIKNFFRKLTALSR